MTAKTRRLCSLMCGRSIKRISDMTPTEIEACLNSWSSRWEEPEQRELRIAARPFALGEHKPYCAGRDGSLGVCDCGLDRLRNSL